jgi:nitrite reductase/ring-hydroxylating ferredoxin subunit
MTRRPQDRVSRFVDDLLKRRRPARFKASSEELEALTAATELAPLRAGVDLPDSRFVERLEDRLRQELEDHPAKTRVWTRRGLLQAAGAAAAAAVVGATVDRTILGSTVPAPDSGTLVPNAAQWRPVATLSELPAGKARTFSTGAVQGVVVNDKGTIRALSGVCTHLGCVLRPNVESRSLDCPCHRTVFAWDGSVHRHQLPSRPASLPTIESRVRDGQIEVLAV